MCPAAPHRLCKPGRSSPPLFTRRPLPGPELPPERVPADAEHAGGLALRAAAPLEHPEHVVALHLGERPRVVVSGAGQGSPAPGSRRRSSSGRCSGSICPPRASAVAWRTTFPSSRTLPGQRYASRSRSASGPKPGPGRFSSARNRRASGSTSSGRSRSGGRAEHQHLEPVVEVLAEEARRHAALEVLVGGADEADVHPEGAGVADPPNLAVLEGAQQLRLERERQLGDLVEEERAAMRRLEQPLLLGGRAGEGAADVAEQLRLEEARRERRARSPPRRTSRGAARRAWSARATTSLPLPLSPRITTGASESAKSWARFSTACMAGLSATTRVVRLIRSTWMPRPQTGHGSG